MHEFCIFGFMVWCSLMRATNHTLSVGRCSFQESVWLVLVSKKCLATVDHCGKGDREAVSRKKFSRGRLGCTRHDFLFRGTSSASVYLHHLGPKYAVVPKTITTLHGDTASAGAPFSGPNVVNFLFGHLF